MKFVVIGAHLLRDDIETPGRESLDFARDDRGDARDDSVAIPVGDLFLSALAVADDQPIGDRELLLRVAAVRAKLLDVATFVAIRYGFSIASPDDAFAKCAAHLPRWKRLLIAHREHVELTLKTAAVAPSPRPDRHDFASGADYLRALHAAKQAATADPRLHAAAERLLGALAIEHRWQQRDEKSVELAALVARARLDEVWKSGELLRAECPDVPFLLSGPWPLEVFADADRE